MSSMPNETLIGKDERAELLKDFCIRNDRLFFTLGTEPKDVYGNAPCPTTPSEIAEIAKLHCSYWNQGMRPRKHLERTELDSEEWEAIMLTVSKFADVLNGEDASFEFCLKFLSCQPIKINRTVLLNSTAFHRITGQRFRPPGYRKPSPSLAESR